MKLPKTPRQALKMAKVVFVDAYSGSHVYQLKVAKKEALRLYNLAPYSWTISYNPHVKETYIQPKDETVPEDAVHIYMNGQLMIMLDGELKQYAEVSDGNLKPWDLIDDD